MRKDVRFRLHFGPYKTPRFRYGATVVDEWRGEVQIVGLSNGRIPWPIGKSGSNRTLIVYGDLAKAIRRESVQAVAHWFGVSPQTVTKWRREIGIVGEKLQGTTRLRGEYSREPWAKKALKKMHSTAQDPVRCQKIADSRRGKKRPPHVVEAIRKAHLGKPLASTTRQKMSEAHKRRGTRPPWLGPPWSAEEDQLVLTVPVAEVVKKTGRTVGAVVSRRTTLRRLGVAILDGRSRAARSAKRVG